MSKKRIVWRSILGVVLFALIIWLIWGNFTLEQTVYTLECQRLPEPFSGYRIAQVSDLHNREMGAEHQTLLAKLEAARPDMIAITGDLVDSRHTDMDTALAFVEKAVEIAPCYYVPGNHEARLLEYPLLCQELRALGVVVLEEAVWLKRGDDTIRIVGVEDPSVQENYDPETNEAFMKAALAPYEEDASAFTVLLSHRPELFEVYKECEMDVVLTGHAHGGQVQIPFLGGVLVPNQGFFPTYDAGLFTSGDTHMVVSRGIGNSVIPIRVNNPPELVIVDLVRG